MRANPSQIKQAITSQHPDVREEAVFYFSHSLSRDREVMAQAIRAIERYGKDSAFRYYSFLSNLIQTDETVSWLIHQIPEHDLTAKRFDYAHAIRSALAHAHPALLMAYAAEIAALDNLGDEASQTIDERVSYQAVAPDVLWLNLSEFCRRHDVVGELWVPSTACNLIEALATHRRFCVPRVRPILKRSQPNASSALCATRLAGELKLSGATRYIIPLVDPGPSVMIGESMRALVNMGSDNVVRQTALAYLPEKPDLRLWAANVLENIHTDLSLYSARVLFDEVPDQSLRCDLLHAMLAQFSPDVIEPGRQFILRASKTPDVLEARARLLAVCTILGVSFPEFDSWVEDAKSDEEFRHQWGEKGSP